MLDISVPEVTSPLTDLIAIDGESCHLSCHVTAPADATVTWYKENMVSLLHYTNYNPGPCFTQDLSICLLIIKVKIRKIADCKT